MNSKYSSSAADQKNPAKCYSKALPDPPDTRLNPADLVLDLHLDADVGSGVQLYFHQQFTLYWHPADTSWIYGPDSQNPTLKAEWETHPDDLHGRLTLDAWVNGMPVFHWQGPWILLQSRVPLDSGPTRYESPSGDLSILYQVSG